MNGEWNFKKESADPTKDLDLKTRPSFIRPETNWLLETTGQGRRDRLWVSLQLSPEAADQLCNAFAGKGDVGAFGEIATKAAIAPASYAALRLAIKAKAERENKPAGHGAPDVLERDQMNQTLGTDLLIPSEALDALHKLLKPGTVVTDAGLALDGSLPDKIELAECIDPLSDSPEGEGQLPRATPVIIAIIDDGIGIANRRFRMAEKQTRIAHFLDLATPCGAEIEQASTEELLARSWTGEDINALLDKYPADDERVYRAMGLIGVKDERQPLRAAASHGTHTLDTAAGFDYRDPAEAERLKYRPVIAVQLPTQVAENRSDAWTPQSFKRALDWILVKADQLSADITKETGERRRLPLIVNCSFGSMAGPQDGWSDVERRITQFVRTYRGTGPQELCTVVMSAGNSRKSRAAARIEIGEQDLETRVSLPWRLLPDDKTPSFVQIWLSETATTDQQICVALRPPGQDQAEKLSKLDKVLECTVGDSVYARLYHQSWPRPEGKRRECVTIAVRPTAEDGKPEPVVPAGLWHIDIVFKRASGSKGSLNIDAHVHRDDVGMFARGKGRQSYFDDPDYDRADVVKDYGRPDLRKRRRSADAVPPPNQKSLVSGDGTLNAYGYGEGTLLVGGYRLSDEEPASYSSSGAPGAHRRKKDPNGRDIDGPDLSAVTEESPSLPGVLASGTSSGSVAIMNGTSVAAPLATRALADKISAGRSVTALRGGATEPGDEHGPRAAIPDDAPLRLGEGLLTFDGVPGYRRRGDGPGRAPG